MAGLGEEEDGCSASANENVGSVIDGRNRKRVGNTMGTREGGSAREEGRDSEGRVNWKTCATSGQQEGKGEWDGRGDGCF